MHLEQKLEFAQDYSQSMSHYQVHSIDPLASWDPYGLTTIDKFSPRLEAIKNQQRRALHSGSLSTDEIDYALSLANKRNMLQVVLDKAETHIRRTIDYFRTPDEIDEEFHALSYGRILRRQVITEWGVPCIINGQEAAGLYDISGKRVKIKDTYPDAYSRLILLASSGNTVSPFLTYTHEKTHAVQYMAKEKLLERELIEAHAYRVEQGSMLTMNHQELVNFIVSSPLYPNMDIRRLNFAVWAIDRLHALGISQPRIFSLVRKPGFWNEVEGSWVNIQFEVEKAKWEQQVDDLQLEEMHLAYQLKQDVDRLQARNITQQVLYASFKEEINDRRNYKDKRRRMMFVITQNNRRRPDSIVLG